MTRTFNLWAFGDVHVGTELRHGAESLADVLKQSEGRGRWGFAPFHWDLAVNVGDYSGGQAVPEDQEGREVVRQFSVLRRHPREAVYSVCGNHDRSGLDEPPAWWFRKYVDPMGEHPETSGVHPERRPYLAEGTWQRYSVRVGNLLFLMMSDINEPSQTVGRGTLGGNPAGVVSGETFRWWRTMVEANPNCLVVSVHHYMLKDTTVASGEWEGMKRDAEGNWVSGYHGYKPQGAPRGASYLYFVDSVPDAQAFEGFLAERPGAVALWLGGHTHAHPDDTYGGKSHIETKWGAHHVNCAGVTRHHGGQVPMSRVLTFTDGSPEVLVRCMLHTEEIAPPGWYEPAERTLALDRPFVYPDRSPGVRPVDDADEPAPPHPARPSRPGWWVRAPRG